MKDVKLNRNLYIIAAIAIAIILSLLVHAAVENLYATSQSCTPGGDCTVASGANTIGTNDGTIGSASGSWAQKSIIWTFTMSDSAGIGVFNNASITIYNLDFSWTANGQSDTIDLEYCIGAACTVLATFTSTSAANPVVNVTYDAPNIASFQNADDTTIRFVGVAQNSGPDSMAVILDAVSINVDHTPPDLTPPSITLNYPPNNAWDLDGDVTFNYTPNDNINLSNCTITIDGIDNQTNTSPDKGQVNSFFVNNLADGNHNWNVTCIDTSDNSNTSLTRNVRIDTVGPIINLENPPDDNVSTESDVTFHYNATDAQTSLLSCELIVDGSVRDTASSPAESTSLSLGSSLTNGDHDWNINCTDTNGFETSSETRNISIQVTDPIVVPNKGSYTLGETILINGENWNSIVELTFNYTLSNGSIITHTNSTSASGEVGDNLFLNYSYPSGTYNLLAYQTNDITENATTSFTVNLPPTTITTSKSSYGQGDEVFITGTDYSPNSNINITITFSDSSTDYFTVSSDGNGDFTTSRNLSYSAPTGLANITGIDLTFPQINASTNFTVNLRIASLFTDQETYGRDADVNVSGFNFTRNNLSTLAIYDNDTGDIGPSFPINVSTNDIGYFYNIWNTDDTCNGVYRVEAVDNERPYLNDTIYFNISQFNVTYENTTITSGFTSLDSSAITVSLVNDSDGQAESQGFGGGGSGDLFYYELNFTNDYSLGINIDSVIWQVEHQETSGIGGLRLEWHNGTGYESVFCSGLDSSVGSYVNDTCELAGKIDTVPELNSISLRFQLEKTGSGAQTSFLDFTQLRITTSFQPACTYFNGSFGGGISQGQVRVGEVLLEDDITWPANQIDLTAGSLKQINCNTTVNDGDGFGDISLVNATLYSASSSLGAPDSNLTHYTNSSCSFINSPDSTNAVYNCGFDVAYYAENNTWTCSITATDGESTDSNTDTSVVNQLFALNVSTNLIDYGDISINNESSEIEVNISNLGNQPINITVWGYGGNDPVAGANLSLVCPGNNISIEHERFSAQSSDYSSKIQLDSTPKEIGYTLPKQTTATLRQNSTYWQLFIPDLDPIIGRGLCNGTVVFQAEAS